MKQDLMLQHVPKDQVVVKDSRTGSGNSAWNTDQLALRSSSRPEYFIDGRFSALFFFFERDS